MIHLIPIQNLLDYSLIRKLGPVYLFIYYCCCCCCCCYYCYYCYYYVV